MAATIHKLKYADRDKGYRFSERDPDLEFICNAISASEASVWQISKDIGKATGGAYAVAPTTMYNWLDGKVKRPQNYTMTWVAFALGYQRQWVKI